MPLERNKDFWKRWMLVFHWDVDEEVKNETFYFDTKEAMIKFIKQDGVRVIKMFHLEDVEL